MYKRLIFLLVIISVSPLIGMSVLKQHKNEHIRTRNFILRSYDTLYETKRNMFEFKNVVTFSQDTLSGLRAVIYIIFKSIVNIMPSHITRYTFKRKHQKPMVNDIFDKKDSRFIFPGDLFTPNECEKKLMYPVRLDE